MKGNAEFLILFIPFLLIFIGAIYSIIYLDLDLIIKIGIGIIGLIALTIDSFALAVQYVNWKYYKE